MIFYQADNVTNISFTSIFTFIQPPRIIYAGGQ